MAIIIVDDRRLARLLVGLIVEKVPRLILTTNDQFLFIQLNNQLAGMLVVDTLSLMLLVLVENGMDLGNYFILEIFQQRKLLRVSTICITMLMVVLVLLRRKVLFRLPIVLGHLQFRVKNRQEADIHFLDGRHRQLLRLLLINRVIQYA